jgi:mRNA interferase MazF
MKEGDVILTPLEQVDGKVKNRPAIILREMPPHKDFLVCGISTQLHQLVPGFDEMLKIGDEDFVSSGLISDSVIRLGFLAVLPRKRIIGSIGEISSDRHKRLLNRLAAYLKENI